MALIQDGFIFMWRCFRRTSFYTKPLTAHLALHLLLEACHEEQKFIFNNQEMILHKGQILTGIHKLTKSSGLTTQNVRTSLKILTNCRFLTIKSTNKFSIITICNYSSYQKNGEHCNILLNKPVTNQQQTSNKPVTTYKNVKNVKKQIKTPFSHVCLKNKRIAELFILFEELRNKKKKPLTDYSKKLVLDKLYKQNVNEAIIMLENAIEFSWTSVYPPKEEPKRNLL